MPSADARGITDYDSGVLEVCSLLIGRMIDRLSLFVYVFVPISEEEF